jgi:hypothetical protein
MASISNKGVGSARVTFTEDLVQILKQLESENNYIAFELVGMQDIDAKYHNGIKITTVSSSKKDWCFDVVIDNKIHTMKIGKFIRYFIGNESIVSNQEIYKFSERYNKIKNGEPGSKIEYDPIEIPEFSYNPKDVRSTFLSLVTKTYPHGHEDEVLQFLPKLQKDSVGNYYLMVGKSETMFTSHLDTADRKQEPTVLYNADEKGDSYIITDGTTILGADDKAGVSVMLYMISHNIPGLYYFFIGEERGGIGSGRLSSVFNSTDHVRGIKRCVSFDRRNYFSVITEQMGRRCCSDDFGTALCKEYNKTGLVEFSLDPTGIYTDSASFIDDIPECTNISVGYFHEHTGDEYQNMTFLENLCKASILVNWEGLPTVRKVGIDQEIVRKYKNFLSDVKASAFELEVKLYGFEGQVFLRVDLEESDIDLIHNDLLSLSALFKKHKIDPDILFRNTYLKIELK